MKLPKEWSVYMARCADGSIYTGIAKDIRARLAAHNAGRGAAYTRARRPVKLVHAEKGFTRSTALSREASIKSLTRSAKLALLKAARAAAVLLLGAGLSRATPVFVAENPVSFSSAAPQAFTYTAPASFSYPIRMFFIRASSGTEVGSAASPDGLAWTEEAAGGRLSTATLPSVNASSITGAGVLPLSGGGFRMAYSIVSTTGAFRIHTATSADGLNWANDAGVAIDNVRTFLDSPKLVTLNDASWRMYYAGNSDGGTDLSNRWIMTSRSVNQGLTWSAPSVALATMAYSVGASVLTNGLVRLYYTEPLAGSATSTVVLSALSHDVNGNSFAIEAGFRASTGPASGSLDFPVPVRTTDTFRWRLYDAYTGLNSSTSDVHSALTIAPAPAAMTPNSTLNSASTTTFTITGDIFSGPPTAAAPTVQLSGNGTVMLPSSVVLNSDQSLTAVFNVFDQPPGFYSLTVTNSDGQSAVLPNALNLGFPNGTVSLVNNLLRPRTGTSTAITIAIFNAGQVTARLFTIDGRSVRTLLDAQEPKGSFTLSWDGRDAGGAAVASGLYLLHVNGPNVNSKAKIIVVR